MTFTIASICQYSGRRETSFDLSNTTISAQGSKLWCSDLSGESREVAAGGKATGNPPRQQFPAGIPGNY